MVEASTAYLVDSTQHELVPLASGWGVPLHHSMLQPDKVIVFDFGSEVYVYNGKSAPYLERKAGALLAQELYTSGWDYTECQANPALGGRKEELKVQYKCL